MKKKSVSLTTKVFVLGLPSSDDGNLMYGFQNYRRTSQGDLLTIPQFQDSSFNAAELVFGDDVFAKRIGEAFKGALVDKDLMDMDGTIAVEIPVVQLAEISDDDVCKAIESIADQVGYIEDKTLNAFRTG